jgi:hypothetical protein
MGVEIFEQYVGSAVDRSGRSGRIDGKAL